MRVALAALLAVSFVSAVPVTYVATVTYESTGTVNVEAISSSGATALQVDASPDEQLLVLNHLANPGEIVQFVSGEVLLATYEQPLPGSIVELGVLAIPAPSQTVLARTQKSASGGGGGYCWEGYENVDGSCVIVSEQTETASAAEPEKTNDAQTTRPEQTELGANADAKQDSDEQAPATSPLTGAVVSAVERTGDSPALLTLVIVLVVGASYVAFRRIRRPASA